jgi:hypothetical protein
MALPKKPQMEINVNEVNKFINGENEKEPSTGNIGIKETTKSKLKKESQIEVALSYRIPEDIHEKLQEHVFKHRKEGVTIKSYLLESLIEKMRNDGIL